MQPEEAWEVIRASLAAMKPGCGPQVSAHALALVLAEHEKQEREKQGEIYDAD